MRISSPSRNTNERNPSHFGSKIQLSPSGKSLTRFASIGKIGGGTARFMYSSYNAVDLFLLGVRARFQPAKLPTILYAELRDPYFFRVKDIYLSLPSYTILCLDNESSLDRKMKVNAKVK